MEGASGPEAHGLAQQDVGGPGRPQGRIGALNVLAYIVLAISLSFFIASIALVFSPPTWFPHLSTAISPYIFVLLLAFYLPTSSALAVSIAVFVVYSCLFAAMVYMSRRQASSVLDTPVGYFTLVSSSLYLIVYVVSLAEISSGVSIGGSSISNELTQHPLLGFLSLIYAPFAEEIGFRIIPLGILTLVLVLRAASGRGSARDVVLSFVSPGTVRRKYGIRFGTADYAMIVFTAAVWAYAHIFFGAWSWGKFLPVFIAGIAIAVGFLKFGIYVDIPMHWFFNGFFTVYVLNSSLLAASSIAWSSYS